jgi:isoquinoline 1-oxidoreductase beta subunit
MPIEWDGGAWATADNASIFSNLQTGLDGPPDKVLRNDGDVNSAMSAAAQTLEAVYHLPYLEHATMEPMNCTALVTDDGFEVWAPTQAPERAIKIAAKAAGMPVSKGNLHVTHMGGGFGRRQNSDFVRQAVKIAKAMKGTPVKLLWSRKETIQHSFFHPTNLSRVRAALDSDGNPIAWSHRLVAPSTNGGVALLGADSLLYAVPNMMVDFVIRRSHVPEGQMRGVGFANNGFVAQCFIDELARAANKDVYAFQHDLLDPNKTPAMVPPGKIEGQVIHDVSSGDRAARLRSVLDEAAKRADWHKPLGSNSGRGIAVHEQADAYYAVVVEVTLDGTGWFNIDRIIVAGDPSFLLNPKNADAQVEGSVVFGLNSAMYGEITIQKGRVVESNLEDYRILRFPDVPTVEIHWVLSRKSEWGGIGDPVVPPIAPALANAIYDAGGPRIRSLPLKNHKIVNRTP